MSTLLLGNFRYLIHATHVVEMEPPAWAAIKYPSADTWRMTVVSVVATEPVEIARVPALARL